MWLCGFFSSGMSLHMKFTSEHKKYNVIFLYVLMYAVVAITWSVLKLGFSVSFFWLCSISKHLIVFQKLVLHMVSNSVSTSTFSTNHECKAKEGIYCAWQSWMQHHRWSLSRAEQEGRILSLIELATLL